MVKGDSSIRAICISTIAVLLLISLVSTGCGSNKVKRIYVDEEIRRLSMLMLDLDLADPVGSMGTLDAYFKSDYSNKTVMLEELDDALAEVDKVVGEIFDPEDIDMVYSQENFFNLRGYVFLKANNMRLLIEFIKRSEEHTSELQSRM